MEAILVTHSHWDREWYRTFQDFRAHLVDLVDRVLDLCAEDPGYRFLLDGQTVVLEDYLEIRPDRRDELRMRCAEGRIGLGPWYVQPDSLLPSGEAHVRNLLLGRSVGETIGPVSREGYTPDSFGHPAQFPQLFAGFGIRSFVYWRGHGREIDTLPAEYDWVAPDGSRVIACHLGRGYFCAATPPGADLERAGPRIAGTLKELAARTRSDVVLLLNGVDHAPPESRTQALAEAIGEASGFAVERGLLEDFVDRVERAPDPRPEHHGELVGAGVAPLLPGVWSTRTWIKLANRAAENTLEGFAEPFAALSRVGGAADERAALRLAWKELLKNQAHDSICGCSRDEVHQQMRARFDAARELAEQTATRSLERMAGASIDRVPPFAFSFEVVVANPSPRTRTDVVRFPLDFHPYSVPHPDPRKGIHPTVLYDLAKRNFTVDGVPARLVPAETGRAKLIPQRGVFDLEFVARDVPAFGLRRVQVSEAPEGSDAADVCEPVRPGEPEARIEAGSVALSVNADGTFDAQFGNSRFAGLGGLESLGDRGDSYDFDPVEAGPGIELVRVEAERRQHPGGTQELCVRRVLDMPARLGPDRRERGRRRAQLVVESTLRIHPALDRVDLELLVHNEASDHRLRWLAPLPGPVESFEAASTFEVARRTPGPRDEEGWVQAPPETFPQQGFVHAGGLTVVAPGLSEAAVVPGDAPCIAITLLRCVGSLSRQDLETRPGLAGPGTDTPEAQCLGPLRARMSLFAGLDPAKAREVELGLRAVAAGPSVGALEGRALLEVAPQELLVTALKPADQGPGLVLRVLNPTDRELAAEVALGFEVAEATPVRLDETSVELPLERDADALRFPVPPGALRSLRLIPV